MTGRLLVVAGEASGDRAAAAVIAKLRGRCQAFGMGGGALQREGVELLADLRALTALGVTEVARRAYGVGVAWRRLRAAIKKRRPSAALLVNYTEFNARLAPTLWSEGTRVLWYGAPQIWAWRAGRAEPLRRHLDRLALMLPFEEPLWRGLGVDAHYVGHPALEDRRGPEHRVAARELLGLTPFAWAVAILPGSRPHEVRRLLEPMLTGYEIVRGDRASVDARVMLAASLTINARVGQARGVEAATSTRAPASRTRCRVRRRAASGTACRVRVARVVPVVCYRVGGPRSLRARSSDQAGRAQHPRSRGVPRAAQRRAAAVASPRSSRGSSTSVTRSLQPAPRSSSPRDHPCPPEVRMLEPWLAPPSAPEPRKAC